MAYAKHLQMGVPRDEELKEFVSIEAYILGYNKERGIWGF